MKFGKSFYTYCKIKNIGKSELSNSKNEFEFLITQEEFNILCSLKTVCDGQKGGLVLGIYIQRAEYIFYNYTVKINLNMLVKWRVGNF